MRFNRRIIQNANFNSIKVRLEQLMVVMRYLQNSNFNSIKVRLELKLTVFSMLLSNFNSIKVRLEHPTSILLICTPYFNSIKVRLEQEWAHGVSSASAFQFHKGAIRTSFHKGLFTQSYISIP